MEERARAGKKGAKEAIRVGDLGNNVIDLDPQRASEEQDRGRDVVETHEIEKDDNLLSDSEHRFYAGTIERLQRKVRWLALTTLVGFTALFALVAILVTVLISSSNRAEDAAAEAGARALALEEAIGDESALTAEMFGVGTPEEVVDTIKGLAGEIDEVRRQTSRTRGLALERTRCAFTVLRRQHRHFGAVARGRMSVAEYVRRISPANCRN